MEPGAEDEDNPTAAGGAKYSEDRDADPDEKQVCIIIYLLFLFH